MATYMSRKLCWNVSRNFPKFSSLQAVTVLQNRHAAAAPLAPPSSSHDDRQPFRQPARQLSHVSALRTPARHRGTVNHKNSSREADPYQVEAEKCLLCKYQVPVSYKNVQFLSQFVSPNTGRVFSREITKLCEAQHDRVTVAIRRAIQMGFMPNQHRATMFLKDPNLYDIRYTGNPAIGQASKLPDSSLSEEEVLEAREAEKAKPTS